MKLYDLCEHYPIVLSEGGFSFIDRLTECSGKVVQGVNTTPDVKVGEIKRQAKKFGFTTSEDGVPPVAKTNGSIR